MSRYGDSIDFRKDVRKVQETKRSLFCYQPGVSGVGLRYISPIVWNGQLVGSVEVVYIVNESFLKNLPGEAILYQFLDEQGKSVELVVKSKDVEDFSKKYDLEKVRLERAQKFNDGKHLYVVYNLKDVEEKASRRCSSVSTRGRSSPRCTGGP